MLYMSNLVVPLHATRAGKSQTKFQLGYRPLLTGLRGVAVSCVVLFHIRNIIYQGRTMMGTNIDLTQGYLGVDIFFVLSGFLITLLLIEEWESSGKISLKAFYMRRALRLLPALTVFLSVMIVYALIAFPYDRAFKTTVVSVASLGYSTNWLMAFHLYAEDQILSHTWSLAIEEQFYLVWPLLFIFLLRCGLRRRTILIIVAVAILSVLFYRVTAFHSGAPLVRIYNGTDMRGDSLLIGCLAAMLLAWNVLPRLFQRALGIAAFISTLVITMYLTGHNRGAVLSSGFTIYGLAVAIVLISLVREPPRLALRLLECRPLVWLGEISYAVYLWHFFAITLAMRWIDSPAMVSLMAMAFTLAFASLSYYLIEKPFLRLKKRFQKVGEQSSQLDQRLGHNLGDYAIPS